MNGAILKLLANGAGYMNQYYAFNCVEELVTIKNKNGEKEGITIGSGRDAIREIYLVIKLPELLEDQIWREDLLLHLLDEIRLEHSSILRVKTTVLDKNIINKLLQKHYEIFPKNRFVGFGQRAKRSRQKNKIFIPLCIGSLLHNPSEIIMLDNLFLTIKIKFNLKNLTENVDDQILRGDELQNISWYCKLIEVHYDTKLRNQIKDNIENHIKNQTILETIV